MTNTSTTPSPLATLTQTLLADWQVIKSNLGKDVKLYWKPAVSFMLSGADQFIIAIEPLLASGTDKEAAVIDALNTLYSQIIVPLMPIYIKPFSSQIQSFVIGVVASDIIAFIVLKYNTLVGGIPAAPATTTTTPA